MLLNDRNYILFGRVFTHGEWRDASIEVHDGRLRIIEARIEPAPAENADAGRDALGFSDCYILPGLADCHVHLALDAVSLHNALAGWTDAGVMKARVAERLSAFLDAGVTRVRDGGDAAGIGLLAQRMVADGQVVGPQVRACVALRRERRYGKFLGPGIRNVEEGFGRIDAVAAGASCIKICQSGLVSFKRFGEVGGAQFSLDELSLLVAYAHDRGLSVMAHASGAEAVDIAVRAGADTVEHGYYLTRETIGRMAAAGTVWVPTLSPLANLLSHPEHLSPGAQLDVIGRAVDDHKAKIALAFEEGVQLSVGTDAGAVGVAHGTSIYDEIEHMVSAGIPRIAVVKMAYRAGRHVLPGTEASPSNTPYDWIPGESFDAVVYRVDPFTHPVGRDDVVAVCAPQPPQESTRNRLHTCG